MNIKLLAQTLLAAVLLPATAPAANLPGEIRVERVPAGGLQPQVRVGEDGTIHLIQLGGDPKSADVHYRRRSASDSRWSEPIRVNSESGSATAMGTIRGAQLALGRNGRVHVAWNGSKPVSAERGSPMLYARLNEAGKGFEPQRNLMTMTRHLDGGGSVAADQEGRVFVIWHAGRTGGPAGEAARAVFLAGSTDDGKTFAPERVISPAGTGACGCCGLIAHTDAKGDVFLAYRIAATALKRDLLVLRSTDHGGSFKPVLSHPWNIGSCPMSSAAFADSQDGMSAAWESQGKVFLSGRITAKPEPLEIAPGKHPRLATNARGEALLAWAEGTGWQRGGAVIWQRFDAGGKPVGERGRREGLPAWSFPAVFATSEDGFTILY